MTRPIVFLDIDGVLNSQAHFATLTGEGVVIAGDRFDASSHIDPTLVERLNRITQATCASVVLSTSWRVLFGAERTTEMLKAKGMLAEVIGETPRLLGPRMSPPYWPRGKEIAQWLDANPCAHYVVLDDDRDAGIGHESRYVEVPDGLTDAHVARAIEVLR